MNVELLLLLLGGTLVVLPALLVAWIDHAQRGEGGLSAETTRPPLG